VAAERDPKTGRFVLGTSGNPNGRGNDRQAKLHAMLSAVSVDDAVAIIQAQVAKAKEGNTKAAEFVCDRLFGKAPVSITLLGPDGKPAVIIREIVVEKLPPPGVIVAV